MTGKTTFIRAYNYDVCLAPGKIWVLSEAADYLAAYLASRESWSTREDAYKGLLAIKDRLLTAMKQDIDEGSLVINEVYLDDGAADIIQSDLDINKSTVWPFIFINWALANDVEVPAEFV